MPKAKNSKTSNAKKPAAKKTTGGKGYYLCHSISATRFPVSFLLPANSHGILCMQTRALLIYEIIVR